MDKKEALSQLLHAAFPEEVEQSRMQGGQKLTFAPWHAYVTRLNDVAYGEWKTAVPFVGVMGEYLLMVVEVYVNGVGHQNVGIARVDKDKAKGYGGAAPEAFSQGFRRACAMHGLGLYFYEDEDKAPPPASQVSDAISRAPDSPPAPEEGPMTEKQRELIKKILSSHVFTAVDKGRANVFIKRHGRTAEAASTLITKLKAAERRRKREEARAEEEEDPF